MSEWEEIETDNSWERIFKNEEYEKYVRVFIGRRTQKKKRIYTVSIRDEEQQEKSSKVTGEQDMKERVRKYISEIED